ncbi:FG-GAP-like repeat-containing protein [Sphingobium estronivorans]|uniref:FG-GAP-like repeat-containing protein n=1 Tax=Sphingobium estronivorans TaxID=1577690 RepID=UPI001238E11B|nr:FG-GAP-like repeat-containing protein [Sphingobium estronivorans]
MHIDVLGDSYTYQNSISISGAPAFNLIGNQINFFNIGSGLITQEYADSPAIVVTGTGSLIENQSGAIIQGFGRTVVGGDGSDTIRNYGAIYGTIDLANGDDHVITSQPENGSAIYNLDEGNDVFEFRPSSRLNGAMITTNGGTGMDEFILTGQIYSFHGQNVLNFEHLVIDAPIGDPFQGYANNLLNLSGFSVVDIRPGSVANFLYSVNPLADINVSGGSIGISRGSVFKSLTGNDQNDFISIDGDGHVLGIVDLGDGDDTYFLSTDGSKYVAPVGVKGGAGQDALKLVTSGQWDIDLSIYTGFEQLEDGGNPRIFDLTLRHADGYSAVDFQHRNLLSIVDSFSPNAYVNGLAGHVEISASSIVGRYGFASGGYSYSQLDNEPIAVADLGTDVVNYGTILGDVQLYFGDDLYDGRGGNVLGAVYGYAGNDILLGGVGADNISGGYGADTLKGYAGDDVLSGGAGDDVIDGGTGIDTAVYSISRSQATVTHNVNGTVTISASTEGIDTVSSVEQFQFADGLYSLQFGSPSSVVVSNFAVGTGGWTSQDSYPRHVADLNGDGYGDIVGFGFAGMWASYGAANGSFAAPALASSGFGETTGWTSDNKYHRAVADVNGDGRADIVGFGVAGSYVSLAQSNGSYAAPALEISNFGTDQGWGSQDGFARTTGDVNGDGFADVIGFGVAGTYVALGNGDGSFQAPQFAIANFGANQGWTSDNGFHRVAADVNGDGKDDIIGFGVMGTYVALSNGDGSFAAPQLALDDFGTNQGWASQNGFARTAGDINGDSFEDIVGFGTQGTWVAFGNAGGTFSPPSFDVAGFSQAQGWTSDLNYHRELSDLNGDGYADIVGFGYAGVYTGINHAGDLLI